MFGPASFFSPNERSHFDLGRDFFVNAKEGKIIISYYPCKNSHGFKRQIVIDISLDALRAVYETSNSITEQTHPKVGIDLKMGNTISEIILTTPIFSQEIDLLTLSSFSIKFLKEFSAGIRLGDLDWNRLSISDDHKYQKIVEINRKLGDSMTFDFDNFQKVFSKEYSKSTDKFIKSLGSSKNVLSKYYGTHYNSRGEMKFGLVLDGSINIYMQTDQRVYLDQIKPFLETTEGLITKKEGDRDYLIGSYMLGFKMKKEEGKNIPVYRLFKLDEFGNILQKEFISQSEWQLGYAKPLDNGGYDNLPPIQFTDSNGYRLYGKYGDFQLNDNGIIELHDNGDEWYTNSEILEFNTLGDGTALRLFGVRVTRFGNTYRIVDSGIHLTNMKLKFGVNLEYSAKRFYNLKAKQKGKYTKLKPEPFLNYYRLSTVDILNARKNLEQVYAIVSQQINTFRTPEILNIDSKTLKILNAYLENGVVKDGLDKKGIKQVFERFLGNLNSLNYEDDNNILYRICFNGVRNVGDEYKPSSLVVRQQSMEDWYRAVLEMFKGYTPEGNDRIDKLLKASGIDENTVFTSSFDSAPTDADIKLAKILKELVIKIFGRYTYISMITGSLFVKDGSVDFISHPWQTFFNTARRNGITLLHQDIPLSTLSKLESRDSIYRAYSILLDLITLGPQVMLKTGTDPKIDFEVLSTPHIPMKLWMPMYVEAHELDPTQLVDFYGLLSSLSGSMLIEDFPSIEYSIEFRAFGNMMLFEVLYHSYVDLIDSDNSLTNEQKSMYKLMAREQINFFVFASTASADITKRGQIKEFLIANGLNGFSFTLKISGGYPNNLKTINLNKLFYDKIVHMFGENSIDDIINSLDPLSVHPRPPDATHVAGYPGVIEYNAKNILRAQQNQIIKFGNFLKNLAKNVEGNHKIAIQPFNTYSSGFAYSTRADFLSFFPDPENTKADQAFILDGNDLNSFKNSFIKILGGLLVDHQTFVISEVDTNGKTVKHLCAFNLLFGALGLDSNNPRLGLYVPRPKTSRYISAPIIDSFDNTLYDENDPNRIINIMREFCEYYNLIGYQRIGDRRQELTIWFDICNSLMFIRDFF